MNTKKMEEQKSIMSGIEKELKDHFPTLAYEQIEKLAEIVWDKAHPYSEFDYYTQDIIDIVGIVMGN
jgi:hypothetical protein